MGAESGAHNGDEPVRGDHIAKTDIQQLHSKTPDRLFNVLDLLPQFFNLGFHIHHNVRDGEIGTLGADGVGFPVHLLIRKSIFRPTMPPCSSRSRNWAMWLRSRTVSSSTATLSGKDGSLGENTALVNLGVVQHLLQFGQQFFPGIPSQSPESAPPPGRRNSQMGQLAEQVLLQLFTLCAAHTIVVRQGPDPEPHTDPPPEHPGPGAAFPPSTRPETGPEQRQ